VTADFNPGLDEIADVAAMHREGDLGRFLRDQIRAGQARRAKPPPVRPPPPPGRRPGAWPATPHNVYTCPTCNPTQTEETP
jgi:hypothetical protein